MTKLENREVPDTVFDQAKSVFSEAELAKLTLAVAEINCWNRINVAFRIALGGCKPRARAAE